MPHFSPIMWVITGLLFYFTFMFFISLMWWKQNFTFSGSTTLSSVKGANAWNWS